MAVKSKTQACAPARDGLLRLCYRSATRGRRDNGAGPRFRRPHACGRQRPGSHASAMPTHDAAKPLRAPPSGPLAGRIRPPGDKSISHRSLMLGALAVGETASTGLLEGDDVLATAAAMRAFGATVDADGDGAWRVNGLGVGGLLEPEGVIDYGNAGTGVRLAHRPCRHPCLRHHLHRRRLARRAGRWARVLDPLRRMGVQVIARSGDRLPLTITRPRDADGADRVPRCRSPRRRSSRRCSSPGSTSPASPPSSSRSPPATTPSACSRAFGADIETETGEDGARIIRLEGRRELKPQAITVPGDPSSAAFPIVAGADRRGLRRDGRERAPQPDAHRPDRRR